MLPYHSDMVGLACEHLRAQDAEPSIAEHDDAIGTCDRHLRRNLKGGSERLGEHSDVGIDVVGYPVQVAFGNSYEIRKSAIPSQYAKHSACRAMAWPSGQARRACMATAVDLSDHALTGEATSGCNADELVAERASESLVTTNELQVRLADTGSKHPDQHLA